MDELWENIKKQRTENMLLRQRIETCAKMIYTCLGSNSSYKEKLELTKKIIRISSEVGNFRKTADIISSNALQYISEKGVKLNNGNISLPQENKKELRHEHVVPCSVLAELIHAHKFDEINIYNTLIENGIRAIVTLEEDKKLDTQKLKSKMPECWELGRNPLLRYSAAQIYGLKIKQYNIAP